MTHFLGVFSQIDDIGIPNDYAKFYRGRIIARLSRKVTGLVAVFLRDDFFGYVNHYRGIFWSWSTPCGSYSLVCTYIQCTYIVQCPLTERVRQGHYYILSTTRIPDFLTRAMAFYYVTIRTSGPQDCTSPYRTCCLTYCR